MVDRRAFALAATLLALTGAGSSAVGRYRHVLVVSIDGLHAADLSDPALRARMPVLSHLMHQGITYEHARTSEPSDSFPGTLAYLTGAPPPVTGVYYDVSFDRDLTPPGGGPSSKRGAVVDLTERIDRDPARLDGGGDAGVGSIDPAKLPLRCAEGRCALLWPHSYLLVNTVYDVLSSKGMVTSLIEKHPAYAIGFARHDAKVEFYAPEVDAKVALDGTTLVDRTTDRDGKLTLHAVGAEESTAEAYDELKVRALLRELAGSAPSSSSSPGVPAFVAVNFQAVNFAQKAPGGGIARDGRPSPRLLQALAYADGAVGRIVAALRERGLARNTLVIVLGKHGQTPRRGHANLVARSTVLGPLQRAGIAVARMTADDVALLWLQDRSQAARAARVLAGQGNILLPGRGLKPLSSRPSRTPDLVLLPPTGTVYVGDPQKATKRAEHGGFSADDRDVALLVWSAGLAAEAGRRIAAPVATRQIAPTALAALGLDPRLLAGVRATGTPVLPEVFH